MKSLLKMIVVGLMAVTLGLSPALMGLANAGGVQYEGYNSYRAYDSFGYEDDTRGVMFNFSLGRQDTSSAGTSIQDVYRASLTTKQKTGLVLGTLLIAVAIMMAVDEDDCVEESQESFLPGYIYLEEGARQQISRCNGDIRQ